MSVATRRQNQFLQEEIVLSIDHPQVTADTVIKFFKAKRAFRVEKVEYVNPTGLAADPTNIFTVNLKNGSTVVAGPLGGTAGHAADTFTVVPLSATDANLVLAADDVLSLDLDEGGSATLPAGRLVVHGRYL